MAQVAANLQHIRDRIACITSINKRVELVAVSKMKPVEAIIQAYEAGQRHFGENYVVELSEKSHQLANYPDIKWHFIGHLQSNKVKKLLESPNIWMIETVDSEKMAHEINKYLEHNKIHVFNPQLTLPLNIFVQVKTSDDESKTGVSASECVKLARVIMDKCSNLKLQGLMTIASLNADPTPDFQRLVDIRKNVAHELEIAEGELELSMGMSDDFELAIKMGSTCVRVGRHIFGSRQVSSQ